MTVLHRLAFSGVHSALTPSQRRSILLSNIISLILFCLGTLLFITYWLWYGWNIVTLAIPLATIICLFSIPLNYLSFTTLSRIWLTLLLPVAAISISIYAKRIYYEQQQELDYFTFRFIMLASCVFPPVFFSFREKGLMFLTSVAGLSMLMLHDPLHTLFGVPYRQHVLHESNYAFTNIVILITYCVMMGAVLFLKWTSERSENKAATLIDELNATNLKLLETNTEIEAQNFEISAQSESLNESQYKLQEAYAVIEEQKNLLLKQNKSLSIELSGINNDLTATNAELIKHNNELRQFSYTVSHNLRGPVASLIGLISLIDRTNLSEENIEIYGHLHTCVKRLDNIISDLSNIINIRHDIFQIRKRIALEPEIRQILAAFKKDIDTHHVSVKVNLSGCLEIYSVQPMVYSILYNLISNAIKYRTPGRRPEITISTDVNNKYMIRIQDNGLGIDLKNHGDDLFKLYKRFHYHTEGKGLGLYLVKLQAEALGGSVHVSSDINRGTTFTVYLGQQQDLQHQVLYRQPYGEIFFDAEINATGMVWRGPVSSDQYRDILSRCLELVKTYNTPNCISDASGQGYISREDQHWLFSEILPEAAKHGLKRLAAVTSAMTDARIGQYIAGTRDTLQQFGIEHEVFLTLNEATAWIKQENENTAPRKP